MKVFSSGARSLTALEGVDLVVSDREFVSVVGPSGCGKTTLLRIVDGLVEPTEGEVRIDGEPVTGSGRDRGMVFQSSNLLPWLTTEGNIALGLEADGVEREEQRRIVDRLIEMVGLQGFEDAYPHELSGGMRQRVGLARALAIDPDVLLMDEPFGELDAQTRELLQRELLRIWSEEEKTSVFVTHDIEEAIFLSDRIVVLSGRPGRVIREVEIPFDRPRYGRELRATETFGRLREEIWDVIRSPADRSDGSGPA